MSIEAMNQALDALVKSKKALEVLWVSHHANRTDYAIEDIESAIKALRAAIQQAEAQQPASKEHLFELWWEAHMPNATQEQAWTAFTAAVASNGVGIAAQQPATGEPVGWYCTETGAMFTQPKGRVPPDARPLVFGDTHPAPSVPDDVVLKAKRYEWLRNEANFAARVAPQVCMLDCLTAQASALHAEAVDEAIDAAMLAAK